ncbi:MAG: XdhC family protein [Acidobacteria bacterium]|nr:XdhC family protein [Acidobacteriota bacterium]
MTEDIYERIVTLRSSGVRGVLATIIARNGATPRKPAAKMLIDETGGHFGTIGGGAVESLVFEEVPGIIRSGNPKILRFDLSGKSPEENALVCGGIMEVYLEPIIPETTLLIFGAGHVGRALAEIARFAGFNIAVVDDRKDYANIERFPQAQAFFVDKWENVLCRIGVNDNSYIFISTRGHHFDELCLRFALLSSAKYIGMLGSRKKIRLLKEYIEKQGIDPAEFQRVSVPVGFDIGAETPEEIAISITAELVAARKNRDIVSIKNAVHNAARDFPDQPSS